MLLIGLDPGTTHSAMVFSHLSQSLGRITRVRGKTIAPNDALYDPRYWERSPWWRDSAIVVYEQMQSYGKQYIGREVYETVFDCGRIVQTMVRAWHPILQVFPMPRKTAVTIVTGNPRANDAAVRAALIDRFGPGKDRAVGTVKNPGPLHGIKTHLWAALALCVAYAEEHSNGEDHDLRAGAACGGAGGRDGAVELCGM